MSKRKWMPDESHPEGGSWREENGRHAMRTLLEGRMRVVRLGPDDNRARRRADVRQALRQSKIDTKTLARYRFPIRFGQWLKEFVNG